MERTSSSQPPALETGDHDYAARLQRAVGAGYELRELIGRGGFGVVYRAWDRRLERDVAIKALRHDLFHTAEVLQRFQREARSVAKLRHANILPVYTVGDGEGIAFMVMPLIRGVSLKEYMATHGRLPRNEAIRISVNVAGALEQAHQVGIIHRDIKPENILLEGDDRHVLLADFGIAKSIQSAGEATASGVIVGSPPYMSPEQAGGERELDARTDVYSLGTLLYEMLSGQRPYPAVGFQQLVAQHVTSEPTELRQLMPELPSSVASVVMKAIAKRPENRWPNAASLATALEEAERDGSVGAGAGSRRWLSRRLAMRVATGLLGAMVVAALAMQFRSRPGTHTTNTRVAVLPFASLSADTGGEYFAEGLSEEITDALGKAGIQIIGRSSARSLSRQGLSADEIGRRLGVGAVLQGTVQRTRTQVRVTANLSAVGRGNILWSDKYVRDLKDIFALQEEVARRIAASLQISVVGDSTRRIVKDETSDPVAHALYLQGLYIWNRRSSRPYHDAIRFFREAVQRDPSYARAYGGLAMGYVVQATYDTVNALTSFADTRAAAQQALQLDSTIIEAHVALGFADACTWRNADAEASFTRAFRIAPHFAMGRFWYSLYLQHVGRYDEAIAEHERALALDPASLVINGTPAAWYTARRYQEAERMIRHALSIDPDFQQGLYFLARIMSETGRADSAVTILETILLRPGYTRVDKTAALAYAYVRAGKPERARTLIRSLQRNGQLPPSGPVAAALDAMGERERAIGVLLQAVERDQSLLLSRSAPYDGLRSDARVSPLFTRIEGLPR